MSWYKFKWWRFAFGFSTNNNFGDVVTEVGHAWLYLFWGVYFNFRTWRVITIEVSQEEIMSQKAGMLNDYINQKLAKAGADINRGSFYKYFDTVHQNYYLWWEERE